MKEERNLDKSLDLLMAAIYTEIESIVKFGLKVGIREQGKEHYGELGCAYSINKLFRMIEKELLQAENNIYKFLYDLPGAWSEEEILSYWKTYFWAYATEVAQLQAILQSKVPGDNFSQVQVRLDSIELMHWRLNCTEKDRFGYYYYNTELDKEGRRPGEELITIRFVGGQPYEVFDLLEHYWGDFNGCPDYKTVLLVCKKLYDNYNAVLVQLSHDTLVFACQELSEKDRLEIQEEAKQIKVDIVEFNENGFKWWWD